MKIKEGFTIRNCDQCKIVYHADNRNLKRGWGLCCSKKCAAKMREKSKPGYNATIIKQNNERRDNWNRNYDSDFDEMEGHFSNEDKYQDSE